MPTFAAPSVVLPTFSQPFVATPLNPQLLHGDSLLLLPTLPENYYDLIVADPPYSSGGMHQSARNAASGSKYTAKQYQDFHGDNMDGHAWYRWAYTWLHSCFATLKSGGYIMVFTDWRQLSNTVDAVQAAGFTWRGLIAWDKGRASRLVHPGYFRHQCEYIVWATKGDLKKAQHKRSTYDGCIRETVKVSQKKHPTEKPVSMYKHLLEAVPAGAQILDPFLGSGASGEAAVELGQAFTGIEYSRYYYDLAKERLHSLTR